MQHLILRYLFILVKANQCKIALISMIFGIIHNNQQRMSSLRKKLFYYLSYFRKPPWDTGISPPELLELIRTCPPGKALDLGCGTGTNAITLARHGWRVTGIDFVAKAIRKAQKKARQAGVKVDFHIGDVTKIDMIHGQFDLVLDIGCFHSLTPEEKTAYIRNLKRLLAPGGIFLLYGFLAGASPTSSGISPSDIESIRSVAELVRQDTGFDRAQRSSAWFKFEKQNNRLSVHP